MNSFTRLALILTSLALLCQCSDSPTKPVIPNHAPVLTEVPQQVVEEGYLLQFVVQASDSDGAKPAISVINLPVNATIVDSGSGHALFAWEPDLTQSGLYYLGFVASDGHLSDTLIVIVVVTPNRLAATWPMAVGNCWVYEVSHWSGDDRGNGHGESRLDSICVLSSYQRDGVVHWRLYSGVPFASSDIAFRNDSIIGMSPSIPIPSVWSDQTVSVAAGVFTQTYHYWKWPIWEPEVSITFAKNVGVIKYEWFNGLAMHPEFYDAYLISYQIKQ